MDYVMPDAQGQSYYRYEQNPSANQNDFKLIIIY